MLSDQWLSDTYFSDGCNNDISDQYDPRILSSNNEIDFISNSDIAACSNTNDLSELQNCNNVSAMNHFSPKPYIAIKKKKSPKENIFLTPQGKMFCKEFYSLINNKRSDFVLKQCVIQYHNMARKKNPSIQKCTRIEQRSIKRYFNNHAYNMFNILSAIQELQNEGKINYLIDCIPYTHTSQKNE